ncbi:hypothetical protein [Haloarcula laminariae]|nr:hypothetical protein [Halomicroarcula laminariae]
MSDPAVYDHLRSAGAVPIGWRFAGVVALTDIGSGTRRRPLPF